MCKAINTALLAYERDPKIKVVLMRSNLPKAFCAGANIKEFLVSYEQRILYDSFKQLSLTLESFRKPLIASVNKLALGGGFELALTADILVCDDVATFGLPEISLGIFPGMGGTLIAKTIGKNRAMEMILTGKRVPAKDLHAWGVINHIYPASELRAKT